MQLKSYKYIGDRKYEMFFLVRQAVARIFKSYTFYYLIFTTCTWIFMVFFYSVVH